MANSKLSALDMYEHMTPTTDDATSAAESGSGDAVQVAVAPDNLDIVVTALRSFGYDISDAQPCEGFDNAPPGVPRMRVYHARLKGIPATVYYHGLQGTVHVEAGPHVAAYPTYESVIDNLLSNSAVMARFDMQIYSGQFGTWRIAMTLK